MLGNPLLFDNRQRLKNTTKLGEEKQKMKVALLSLAYRNK